MNSSPQVIVVGAGAWGVPAALYLQDQGHQVTLVDRFETGGPFASNGGTSRLWRIADTHSWRAESLVDAHEAMERLEQRLNAKLMKQTGMLWRDDESLPAVAEALDAVSANFSRVQAEQVDTVFPGLRPDGRDALFIDLAGVIHADKLLATALHAFTAAGGIYLPNCRVTGIEARPDSATVTLDGGASLSASQVLLAAGPGTGDITPSLGLNLPLTAYIEQVAYFGNPNLGLPAPSLPALVDCGIGSEPGMYAMSDGRHGYKAGLDLPLRPLKNGTLGSDLDRADHTDRIEAIRRRFERDFAAVTPTVLSTQVCTWTDSADGNFIIGRTHPSVVIACGDSGEGFKYTAFMGEYLADLISGGNGNHRYQEHWSPFRFEGQAHFPTAISAIGRH